MNASRCECLHIFCIFAAYLNVCIRLHEGDHVLMCTAQRTYSLMRVSSLQWLAVALQYSAVFTFGTLCGCNT